MGINGVYKVMVLEFTSYYAMELHIEQDYRSLYATLKDGVLTRTFYNGSVNGAWREEDANSFYFENAQVDDYVDIMAPGREEPVNLTPPGGYHIGGVKMCGTVLNDEIVGTIILKNHLVCSFKGTRIPGAQPQVVKKIRTDARSGKNRFCTCGTGSCTHNGFCDSCHIFESIHCTAPLNADGTPQGPSFPKADNGRLPATLCMNKQQDELFGPLPKMPAPKPKVNADGTKFREHGPHHLNAEDEYGMTPAE
jgi:hypothetical protein